MTAIRNILLTGVPGVGKTTLITEVAERLAALRPVGFFTREIRERGLRRGFEAVSLDGRRTVLAHIDYPSIFRVGKYGVDIPAFEDFLASLPLDQSHSGLVILDEIGKMECFSGRFRDLVVTLLESPAILLSTVALRGGGLIAQVKARSDIDLIEVTPKNRNDLISSLVTRTETRYRRR